MAEHIALRALCVKLAMLAGCLALTVLSFIRAPFSENIVIWGKYYWLTTYEYGFTRRGLAGTAFKWIMGDPADFTAALLQTAWLLDRVFVLAIAGLLYAVWNKLGRHAFCAAAGLMLLSPLLPYQAAQTSGLDVVFLALAAFAAVALLYGRLVIFAALFVMGILTHELTVFLLLPAAVLAGCADRRLRWLPCFCGAVTAAVLVLNATHPIPPGVAARLFETRYYLPDLDPGMRLAVTRIYVAVMNATMAETGADIIWFLRTMPLGSALAIGYALPALAPLFLRRLHNPTLRPALLAGLLLFAWFPLAVGIDFSRLGVIAGFSNLLTLLMAVHYFPAERPGPVRRFMLASLAAGVALYWLLPVVWLWPTAAIPTNLAYYNFLGRPLEAVAGRLYAGYGITPELRFTAPWFTKIHLENRAGRLAEIPGMPDIPGVGHGPVPGNASPPGVGP